jgi:hypothetical protein
MPVNQGENVRYYLYAKDRSSKLMSINSLEVFGDLKKQCSIGIQDN